MEKIIETINLRKVYGNFTAVDDVNMHVLRGDCYGFLGPNGAGKSTTIRMLTSLINPTSGQLNIFGKDLKQHRNAILSKMGAIVEKPDFYTYLSAEKNLELFGKISGTSVSKKRIEELIELVGLKGREKDKVKTYSHGMKQRLGLAQTLLNDPELILLDEPTTGLDPQGIIDIRNLINHLRINCAKTILLSSHILSEIELISTRMIIINKGKTIVEGKVNELLSSHDLLANFNVDDLEKVKSLLMESSFSKNIKTTDGNVITLQLSKAEINEVNKLLVLADISVNEISFKRPLEEYFLKLTTGMNTQAAITNYK